MLLLLVASAALSPGPAAAAEDCLARPNPECLLRAASVQAGQIEDSEHRYYALLDIIEIQVKAGQRQAAAANLRSAAELALQIDDAESRHHALREIAEIQAEAGQWQLASDNLQAATELAPQIVDPVRRLHALRMIAAVQVKAGQRQAAAANLQVATELALQNDDFEYRYDAFRMIAEVQAQAGERQAAAANFARALAAAEGDAGMGARRLTELLGAMAAAGFLAEALSARESLSAMQVEKPPDQLVSSRLISENQFAQAARASARAGEFEQALAAARQAGGDSHTALIAVARAQLRAGSKADGHATLDEARRRAAETPGLSRRERAMNSAEVAAAYGDLGYVDTAMKIVEGLDDAEARDAALKEIASAQTTRSEWGGAITTAEMIESLSMQTAALGDVAIDAFRYSIDKKATMVLVQHVSDLIADIEVSTETERENRDHALQDLAQFLMEKKEFAAARRIADKLGKKDRGEVMAFFVIQHLDRGDGAAAFAVAQDIEVSGKHFLAMRRIAEWQASIGEITAALEAAKAARSSDGEFSHDMILAHIARTVTALEGAAAAIDIVQDFPTASARSRGLASIAKVMLDHRH